MVDPQYLDELTGIYNRRYLNHLTNTDIAGFIDRNIPFSLVIVDIDRFKDINDSHGHLKGDLIIRGFARFLRDSLRATDSVVRFGGDEFLCLMPRTLKRDAEAIYRRMLARVREADFEGFNLTMSAGIASFPEDGHDMATILDNADQALYEAKLSGRDRIGVRGVRRLQLPIRTFIDRHPEKEAFHTALKSRGQGLQIIVVSGTLGIGKTRFVREALADIRGREVMWSYCIPLTGNIAYYPIREMIHIRLARGGHKWLNDMPVMYRFEISKLLPEVQEHMPGGAGSIAPVVDKYRLYEGVRRVFETGKRDKIIVIDNAQWIDQETIEIMNYIVRALADQDITLVFILRVEDTPEYLEDFLAGARRDTGLVEIVLSPFSYIHVNDLIRAALGEDLPDGLIDYAARESGGVPFYIEEIVRELHRGRYLEAETDGWVFRGPDRAVVPKSLTDIIAQKYRHLSMEARQILELGCVIGYFDISIIREITGFNEGHIMGLLAEIDRLGLVRYHLDRYEFSAAITPNALYLKFLENTRGKELHRLVARRIEARAQKPGFLAVEELADHYYQARERDRGVHYCLIAGDRAREKYAHRNALRYYAWVLELLSDAPPEFRIMRSDCLVKRAEILDFIGDHRAALKELDHALPIARETADRRRQARILSAMSHAHVELADFDEANRLIEEAVRLAREDEDRKFLAEMLTARGVNSIRSNHHDRALKYFHEVLSISRETGDDSVKAHAILNLGNIYMNSMDYERARGYYTEALNLNRTLGNRLSEGHALYNIGNICWNEDDYRTAADMYEQARRIFRETGAKNDEIQTTMNLGELYAGTGDYERARLVHEQNLKLTRETGNRYHQMVTLEALSGIQLATGDYETAERYLLEAAAIASDIKISDALIRMEKGRLYWWTDRRDEARAEFDEAYRMLAARQCPCDESLTIMADYYLSIGDREKAGVLLSQLREANRTVDPRRADNDLAILEARYLILSGSYEAAEQELIKIMAIAQPAQQSLQAGKVCFYLGGVAEQKGEREQAQGYYGQAREIFTRFKARGWLAKVESLLVNQRPPAGNEGKA